MIKDAAVVTYSILTDIEWYNVANLTLASPGTTNSLGANKALIIDTSVPTVTGVTSTTSNGSYKLGDLIAISVEI